MKEPILLKKIITRYGSVAAIWSWYMGTSYDLRKNLGAGFTDMLLITNKDNIICYRSQRNLHAVRKLLFRLMRNPGRLQTFWKGFSRSYNFLKTSIHQIARVKRDPRKLAVLIRQVDEAHRQGWTGLVISYWLPVFLEEAGLEKKCSRIYSATLRMRSRFHGHFSLGINFFNAVHKATSGNTRWLTPDEIINYLKTGQRPVHAENRAQGYYCFDRKLDVFHTRPQLANILKAKGYRVESEKPAPKVMTLRGMPAQPGSVRGKVHILLTPSGGKKFQRGDILVAISTEPDYIPIIRRAGAVVTDEGGIVSHAAIISRELRIPCIVGTKIATKVLKDGDRVFVDATKGIVRKFK